MSFVPKKNEIRIEIMASAIIRRGMATSAAVESAIKHVTVIGGGLMGSGIAQVSVFCSHSLSLSHDWMCLCARKKLSKHCLSVWLFDLLRHHVEFIVHSPKNKTKNKTEKAKRFLNANFPIIELGCSNGRLQCHNRWSQQSIGGEGSKQYKKQFGACGQKTVQRWWWSAK